MKKWIVLIVLLAASSVLAAPPSPPLPPKITAAQVSSPSGDTASVTISPDAIYDIAVAVAGAGSVEVQDEGATAANFNGDETHAVSQDDFIDYMMATIDDDGDGSIADSTLSIAGLTVSGAGGLELGVAGTTLGTLKIYSNTPANNFSFDLYGANFTESWGIRVPTGYPAGANYLFNVDADGTGGFTNPATFEPALSAASQVEMETGTEAALRSMSPLRVAQAIAALAASSSGDVLSVGDCTDGACLDGSSDGGTYIRLYDSNSHYTQIAAGDSIGNLTYTLPTAAPAGNNALVVMSTTGAMSTLPATTYQPLDGYLTDIADETLAQGDILYFDGTDIVNLGPGIAGQYLKTGGAAANPSWDDPAGSGDITAVGDSASGAAFTADGTGNTLYFEGTTANDFEVALTAANPGADVTVTIPAVAGTLMLGPSGLGTDNILTKTDGTGNLIQATGISVDDSNNVTGANSVATTSHVTAGSYMAIGADPADAGAIRLPNAGYIMSEADIAGTDVSVIGVTAAEVVAIGASGASGVTITPATTFTNGIANAGTISAGTWQGTAVADSYVADNITLTNITQITNRSLDDIADGSTSQKVAAADVDASGHVNRFYDSDGTGYATITGLSVAREITLVDAAQTLANLGSNQAFTGNNTFAGTSGFNGEITMGADFNLNANEIQSTGNVVLQLGDAAGSNKFSIQDSGGVEVFAINSDGGLSAGAVADPYIYFNDNDMATEFAIRSIDTTVDHLAIGTTTDAMAANFTELGYFDADELYYAGDVDISTGHVYRINGTQINIGNLGAGGNWTPTGTVNFGSSTLQSIGAGTVTDGSSYSTISNNAAHDTVNELFAAINTWASGVSAGTLVSLSDVGGSDVYTSGYLLIGDGTDSFDPKEVSGAITINSSGVTALTVADSTDATSFVAIFDSATGSLSAKTDAGLTYNASTGMLTATGLTGPLTGNASTATAAASQVITDNAIITADAADIADNDYAKFTANGVEGRSYAEVLSDIGASATTHTRQDSATPVIDDPDNFAANFTGDNLYGGTFIANAAGTAALPDPAVGMNFTYVMEGANANIIDPLATGTADTITMNGLAAASDENITSSTSGAMCVFQYRAANSWMATCTGWAEATPP